MTMPTPNTKPASTSCTGLPRAEALIESREPIVAVNRGAPAHTLESPA